jgi:predicted Zn finger-like uncharacterized protein
MEVHCENCDKVYLLDDAFVSPTGTPVKCSGCKHVFIVFPLSGDSDLRTGWQLRGKDGKSRPIKRISDIRDEVSTSFGSDWKKVGDIEEMRPYFRAANPTRVERPSGMPPLSIETRSSEGEAQPSSGDLRDGEEPYRKDPYPGAEIVEGDGFEEPKPRTNVRVGFWLACIAAAAIGGAGFQLARNDRESAADKPLTSQAAPNRNRYLEYFEKGQKYLATDTEASFTQADRRYYQALALKEGDAGTMSALALLNTAWAQNLRDAEIDARMDAVDGPTRDEKPDLKEANKLRIEGEEKISEAAEWIENAFSVNPNSAAAHLAAADYERLTGDFDEALDSLDKSRKKEAFPDSDYIEALILIDRGGYTTNEVLDILKRGDAAETQPRVMYRQARILAANNRNDEALDILKELLRSNPDHLRSRALVERIENGRLVSLRLDKNGPSEEPPQIAEIGSEAQVKKKEGVAARAANARAGGKTGFEDMLLQAERLQKVGNTSDAARIFNQVLYKSPSNIDALTGLGYCYLDLGFKGKAVAYFVNALNVNKSFSPAVIGLARAYKAQGNTARALKYFKKYLSLQPGGQYADLARQNIADLEGKTDQAGTDI